MSHDRKKEQLKAIADQGEVDQVVEDSLPGDVHAAVEEGAITVTRPGTSFSITYAMAADGAPHLVVTKTWVERNVTVPAVAEFRARAWTVANDKARELGWIV